MSELPVIGASAPERRDAARNRERLIAAAHRVLERVGPQGFTLDALAAEAGVGKGTIFRRFGDRRGLADALLDGPMREFQDRLLRGPPPLGPAAPAAERLEAFAAELTRMIDANLHVVALAATGPDFERSPVHGALLLHVQVLLGGAAPQLDAAVTSRLLLGAISAPVIADARAQGASIDEIVAAVRSLVRGLL